MTQSPQSIQTDIERICAQSPLIHSMPQIASRSSKLGQPEQRLAQPFVVARLVTNLPASLLN